MLDFNRHYYDETCSHGPSSISRFEPKPGKDQCDYKSAGLPQTFRFDESNADEKRSCSCRAKSTTSPTSH